MGRREKEVWKKVDLPNVRKDYYEVSSWGRVRNIKGKMLSPFKDKDGYLKYTLYDENKHRVHYFGHRLVAIHFVPNPDKNLR